MQTPGTLSPHLLHLCLSFVADWQTRCILAAYKEMLDVARACTPSAAQWSPIVREIMNGSIEADFEITEEDFMSEIKQPIAH